MKRHKPVRPRPGETGPIVDDCPLSVIIPWPHVILSGVAMVAPGGVQSNADTRKLLKQKMNMMIQVNNLFLIRGLGNCGS